MKRIWKRGRAGERALRRSLVLTYHDVLRAPKDQGERIVKSHLRNKTIEQKALILRMFPQVAESASEQRKKIGTDGMQLVEQKNVLARGLANIWGKSKRNLNSMTPKELRFLKTSIELIKGNFRGLISKMRYGKRRGPKEFSPLLKREIERMKGLCLRADEIISEIDREYLKGR